MRVALTEQFLDDATKLPTGLEIGQLLCGASRFYVLDPKLPEYRLHLRNVVQGQNELPAQGSTVRRHLLKVARFEVVAVELPTEIRRIEIEKRCRTVLAFQHFLVGKAFKLHTR